MTKWSHGTTLRAGLPSLNRPDTHVRDLEELWLGAVNRGDDAVQEPNGPRGEFFAVHLDEVVKRMNQDAQVWRTRLRSFSDDTADWRQTLRSSHVRKSSTADVLRGITALRAWELTATAEERESRAGVWARTYLLEFKAASKDGMAAVRHRNEAAALADLERAEADVHTPTEILWLRRRALTLQATAKRISAFMSMRRRPQDWVALAASFGEAAELSERAQSVIRQDRDSSVALHRMWESLMLLRAHQARGETAKARRELASALRFAEGLAHPMLRGGRWGSVKEITAERHLIDCIEELNKQDAADPVIVEEHLKRWCQNMGKAEPQPSPRRMRLMKLRMAAAGVANKARSGQSTAIDVSAMRRISSEDKYLELNFKHVLEKCARAVPGSLTGAVGILAALSENIREVDGDMQPLPPSALRVQMSPSWLHQQGGDTVGDAYVSLLRYLRVIAEYLWCVYRDRAAELHIPAPELDPKEFRGIDLRDIGLLFANLRDALRWERVKYSTQALDQLCILLADHIPDIESSLHDDSDGVITTDLRDAIVNATLTDLFPLVVRGIADAPVHYPAEVPVVRLDRPREPTVVRGVNLPPPSWPYFGLKPAFRKKDDLAQTMPLRYRKPIHLYSAFTWPTPSLVSVLVEGKSDAAALRAVLDHIYPYWRALDIRIVDCGGDNLPNRLVNVELKRAQDDRERASAIVILADADKKTGTGLWQDVWRQPYAFVVNPDLERLDLSALAEALTAAFDHPVDVPDLLAIDNRFLEAQRTRESGRKRTFAHHLEEFLDLPKGALKTSGFGHELGRRLARYENPTVAEACRCIIELADGWDPIPQFDTRLT